MSRSLISIVTDGACSANGRAGSRGGWAAILSSPDGRERVLTGAESPSTNNRMELRAAIEGLRAVKAGWPVLLCTDSTYVAHAITKGWLAGWRARGWAKARGRPLPNAELWQELWAELERHGPQLSVEWVRGHAGHPANERADRLAVAAAKGH